MVQAPDWSIEEFEILLNNNNVSGKELAQQLPQRTPDAIEVVRQALHSFHLGSNVSMLSKMMLRRLEGDRRPLTCAICGTRLNQTQ